MYYWLSAFLAGILQSPFFEADLPKYVDYGGVGYIVGHEMTHGFDDVGRRFDEKGALRDWWNPETQEKFIDKTRCVINQYGNYTEKTASLKVSDVTTS